MGVKNQNFKKSKKVPLDILEIHVVSKFGPIPMKIAACRCCYEQTNERTNDRHLIPPTGNYTYKTPLNHPPHSTTCPKGLVVQNLSFITKRFALDKITWTH